MKATRKVRNHMANFNLAGFTYYDGVEVFGALKVGTKLKLVHEPDNPYDAKAVAIYFKNKKLGFIPRDENRVISKFLNLGYNKLFEAYINRITPDEHPENQLGVVIKIKDIEDKD